MERGESTGVVVVVVVVVIVVVEHRASHRSLIVDQQSDLLGRPRLLGEGRPLKRALRSQGGVEPGRVGKREIPEITA